MTIQNLKKLFEVTKKQWLIQHQDEAIDIANDNFDGGIKRANYIVNEVWKQIEEMEGTYLKYKVYETGTISSGELQQLKEAETLQQEFSF